MKKILPIDLETEVKDEKEALKIVVNKVNELVEGYSEMRWGLMSDAEKQSEIQSLACIKPFK